MTPPSPSPSDGPSLDRAAWADRFAAIALANLTRDYPYSAQHTVTGPDDRALPAELHPAFGTSYDWHSSVHMHWLAARLVAFGVVEELRTELVRILVDHLRAAALAAETAYLEAVPHYERPYGWAWFLRLAAEVTGSTVPELRALAPGFVPAVELLERRIDAWTTSAVHPVRHGAHANSAFGLLLAARSARSLGRPALETACARAARDWFGGDRGWPFAWERSGHDFLSAGLTEADLMRAVLPADGFAAWAVPFLEDLEADGDALAPTRVRDESDPQQVHLFGLDLSRAGSARRVAAALSRSGSGDARRLADLLAGAAEPLLANGLRAAVGGDYVSTHWLASFAWDAMEAREDAADAVRGSAERGRHADG